MKIALVDSFFSGSHKQWGLNLKNNSTHQFKIFSMVGLYWKWRMHGGAITLSEELNNSLFNPDLILVTDMIDVSVFKSLLSPKLKDIPIILYFHENQIMYPKSKLDSDLIEKRDNHYGFINFTSALAADRVIFNSNFHFKGFLTELKKFLSKFPDYPLSEHISKIQQKSTIIPVGVKMDFRHKQFNNNSPIILWNHRWEYDKNPSQFFKILFRLKEEGIKFNLNIIGENFKSYPKIFNKAKQVLEKRIINWGYIEKKESYHKILSSSDILPITSNHDFFGISTVEAIVHGVIPLLPNRLTYPEHIPKKLHGNYLYNSEDELYIKLKSIISGFKNIDRHEFIKFVKKYELNKNIIDYDNYFTEVV